VAACYEHDNKCVIDGFCRGCYCVQRFLGCLVIIHPEEGTNSTPEMLVYYQE
jgi:hypothetical protein